MNTTSSTSTDLLNRADAVVAEIAELLDRTAANRDRRALADADRLADDVNRIADELQAALAGIEVNRARRAERDAQEAHLRARQQMTDRRKRRGLRGLLGL